MSIVLQVGSSWPGFPGIRRLVIFGDSYSSFADGGLDSAPCALHPLGVQFPGVSWLDLPNWVGHLITKYCPEPRYSPDDKVQEEGYVRSPLLVYNHAKSGDRVPGVVRQVGKFLSEEPDWAPGNSLFITWIGINDCAYSVDHSSVVQQLFAQQENLYSAGARNFLFVDVPPIHKSPAGRSLKSGSSYEAFNTHLHFHARAFAAGHADATVMLFSSWSTFSRFLDNPVAYGFEQSDSRKIGGAIWYDHLHPTSKAHDLVAKDLAEFVGSVV